MNAAAKPIPARMKGLNRAEICDVNFTEFVKAWDGAVDARPSAGEAILDGSVLDARGFRELFESQLVSRHLDLMARVLRVQNKVFYTIGSSGHEGNAMVARLARHTDPAFLHYRSGGFMAERFRKLPGMDPVMDSALSFAASKDDPASGGRHKVWGSKPLWVLPQTSTIASHLPKALGTAVAIEAAKRLGHKLPVPDDSIAICSFGDASANHATAVPSAFGRCEAMVEVCGSTHSGLLPQTLWRPPEAGSSLLAAKDSAESITGSMPGSLRKRSAMKPPER